jgi:hypothetical protein
MNDGVPKISDFGVSVIKEAIKSFYSLGSLGTWTFNWMAPGKKKTLRNFPFFKQPL